MSDASRLGIAAIAIGLQFSGCAQHSREGSADGSLTVQVEVLRDDWGVPHIFARTEDAGYFGLGYAQAEDQGERFMRMVLSSIGRLAELDGSEALEGDVQMRRWMIEEKSREDFETLDAHVQANYRALAAGFNHFYQANPNTAPAWRFALEPWHLVAVPRGLLWPLYMVNQGYQDCARGGVKLSQTQIRPLSVENRFASNEWVLHPERTADGAMMVLSDPHGPIDGGLFFEYRMHAGTLESAGFTLGGMMLLAHSRHLSWGQTTGAPDVSDCYAVETDPKEPLRYRFDGAWHKMTVREAEISVKGGANETRTFAYTRHNGVLSPVVARSGNTAYVVSTPYMDRAVPFDQEIDQLNHVKTVDEAKTAMRGLGTYANNVMFGDSAGNSWYVRAGRTPKRPDGFDWRKPVPGNSSESAWRGLHPIDDLVQIKNPPHGYMQNQNLAPDQMTLPPRLIDPAKYPAYIYNDEPRRITSRGVRAMELLSSAKAMTVADAIEVALDEKWPATKAWQVALQSAAKNGVGGAKLSKIDRRMLQEILAFDGYAKAESNSALMYFFWRQAVFGLLDREQAIKAIHAQWKGQIEDSVPVQVLLSAVGTASATMLDRYGKIDVPLGEFVRIQRPANDLYGNFSSWLKRVPPVGQATTSYPIGGLTLPAMAPLLCETAPCEQTQRAFWAVPSSNPREQAQIVGGSRILRLTVFTDPIQSFTIHSPGQSDDPRSAHYDDQVRLLLSGRRVKPVYFERVQLDAHVKSRQMLYYSRAQ